MATKIWHWQFDRPVEDIWPLLADTARFNEAAGMPKHTIEDIPQDDGSVLHRGTVKIVGFTINWREVPVNWVSNRWFRHRRDFENGPFTSLCATFEAVPRDDGSEVIYTLEAEPANIVGRALILGGFFNRAGTTFQKLAADAENFAAGASDTLFSYTPPPIADEVKERVRRIAQDVEQGDYGHGMAGRLADLILTAQEADVSRIRPLALAHRWAKPERDVTELCLAATIAGMLEVRWDFLCPRCRGAKDVSTSLDAIPRGAHCTSCDIDYERDFSQNVEISFRPSESIRPLVLGEFCLLGPMTTPHVKAQITVAPGETEIISADLVPGPYRLRSLENGPSVDLDFEGASFPNVQFNEESVVIGEAGQAGEIALTNNAPHDRTMIIEDRRWAEDALTADKITYSQAFRDLFSHEVLRPGDEMSVQRVALMFSDLRGSTALYEDIGEAAAYELVREHFAFMAAVIREHDGAVVKTIGDAVMASFATPENAVAASLSIQRQIEAFNARSDARDLTVKLGVHDGPCIAVTLNGRLDFFGSTVNKAARLQGCSRGGDVVVSDPSAKDPAVAALLVGLPISNESEILKGFDEPVSFVRIT